MWGRLLYDKCDKRDKGLWQLGQLLEGNHVTAWPLSVPFHQENLTDKLSWFSKSQLANAVWLWDFPDKRITMHDAGDEGDGDADDANDGDDDTDDDDGDSGDKCMQF